MLKKLYGENYFFAGDKIPNGSRENYWDSIRPQLIGEKDYLRDENMRKSWQKSCEERVVMRCFNITGAVVDSADEF